MILRQLGRHAGPEFFSLFSYPFLAGNPESALSDPNSVAISEGMSRRFFSDIWATAESPEAAGAAILGEVLTLENRTDITVSAVFEDIQANSSVQFRFVLPAEEYTRRNAWVDDWTSNGLKVFVRLADGADPGVVSEKISNLIFEHSEDTVSRLFLQPYADGYLYSDFENGVLVGGRIEYVRVFTVVALFILLIAGINFTNLATARSGQRAPEIGIRKTVGGTRRSLAMRFLAESVLTSLLALLLAIAGVFLMLPGFNALTGKAVSLSLVDPVLLSSFVTIALVVGLLAGLYPAAYLSSFSCPTSDPRNLDSIARMYSIVDSREGQDGGSRVSGNT